MEHYGLTEAQRVEIVQWLSDSQDSGGGDLLSALSYNLRRVIQLRYGLADGHRYSLEETANIFGKSTQWVAEIEAGALLQLYQFLATAAEIYTS